MDLHQKGENLMLTLSDKDCEKLIKRGRCVGKVGLSGKGSITYITLDGFFNVPWAVIDERVNGTDLFVELPPGTAYQSMGLPAIVEHGNIEAHFSNDPKSVIKRHFGESGIIEISADNGQTE